VLPLSTTAIVSKEHSTTVQVVTIFTNDEEFGLEMRVRYPEDLGGIVSLTVRG